MQSDPLTDDFDLTNVEIGEVPRNHRESVWSHVKHGVSHISIATRLLVAGVVILFVLAANQMFGLWLCVRDKGGPAIAVFIFNLLGITLAFYIVHAYTQKQWIQITEE